MKTYLIGLLAVAIFTLACDAQSRTNRLYRPCSGSSTPAVVEVQRDGDINLIPCSGRQIQINGAEFSSAFTVSGTSRTNFFPYFSTDTNLAKSPYSWNGTSYAWNNTTANSVFTMGLTTDTGSGGSFSVGKTAGTRIFIDGQLDELYLEGVATAQLKSANAIDLNAPSISLASSIASPSYLLSRTITAGGTVGARTINQPAGTVNFAAAASALTVTNSTVTASSIILATARTNDATCSVKNVVAAAGSFVINMTANCTAETSVGFLVTN